jgi:hypothetical protein
MSAKPIIPAVLSRFRAYHQEHPVWGALHIVLDDLNLSDQNVELCRQIAVDRGDNEGAAPADILLNMGKTQRLKLVGVA